MYATRPALRFLLIFGTFGLAALSPDPDLYPTWLVMLVLLAPLVLLELGAGVEDEAERAGSLRLAIGLQLGGALAYVFAFTLLLGLHGLELRRHVALGSVLASLGTPVAFVVLRDGLRRLGPAHFALRPPPSRFRVAWLVMLVCLGFVAALGFIGLRRPEFTHDPMFFGGLFFFGGGFIFVLSLELDHLLLRRSGAWLRRLRDLTQLFGFLLFGAGFLVFSAAERGPMAVRGLMALMGAALLLAGLWIGLRRLFGFKGGLSYTVCREGLVERTRRHVLLYPWPTIASVQLGEFQGQPTIHLLLQSEASAPQVLWERRGKPERLIRKRQKAHRSNEALFGASLSIMAIAIDEELGPLFQALDAALESEEARAALPTSEQLLR